jgi:hypothetical protein
LFLIVGPPPPPPPNMNQVKQAAPKVAAADSNDLFSQIASGNLKSRLKKVKPKPVVKENVSDEPVEATPQEIAEERQNLTFELLGYMQTTGLFYFN